MTSYPPRCENCGRLLNRIDHYGIEHLILDEGVYRPVGITDGGAGYGLGDGYGLASETDLRCGYCGASVPRTVREFFYRRWWSVLAMTRARAILIREPGIEP